MTPSTFGNRTPERAITRAIEKAVPEGRQWFKVQSSKLQVQSLKTRVLNFELATRNFELIRSSLSSDSFDGFARLDEERAEGGEVDEAGRGAFWFGDELALRVVDGDLRVLPGLTEVRRELRGL